MRVINTINSLFKKKALQIIFVIILEEEALMQDNKWKPQKVSTAIPDLYFKLKDKMIRKKKEKKEQDSEPTLPAVPAKIK